MKFAKPSSESEKQTQTTVDTIEFDRETMRRWKIPAFQRERRINEKVRAIAAEIKTNGGVLPGIITLGVADGSVWIVDGQHRLAAFELAEVETGYTDVRMLHATVAEMAEEYERLNSSLVRLKPDDILRAKEVTTPALALIRRRCPFVGYDMIRRSEKAPVLSMGMLLKCWVGSRQEVPQTTYNTASTVQMLTEEETPHLIDFANTCFDAWGRDAGYARLWSALNLSLCAWLYRRMVLKENISSRVTRLSREQFRKGLMALSASEVYAEWLVGRHVGERDRGPAFDRIRALFVRRLSPELNGKPMVLPRPPWAKGGGHHH